LARLAEEQSAAGKERVFAQLKDYLWGEARKTGYVEMAARLGMTEGAVKVAVHRLRRRLRDLLREEVAHTVATDAEIDEELRHLIGSIRG
jgi:RNA polymerase sigma-70 factor (ECF subfamily)